MVFRIVLMWSVLVRAINLEALIFLSESGGRCYACVMQIALLSMLPTGVSGLRPSSPGGLSATSL